MEQLSCARCGEPAWAGDDVCGTCAWARYDARALAESRRELAADAARAQEAPPLDGGATT
jgi:hypothetical protein